MGQGGIFKTAIGKNLLFPKPQMFLIFGITFMYFASNWLDCGPWRLLGPVKGLTF